MQRQRTLTEPSPQSDPRSGDGLIGQHLGRPVLAAPAAVLDNGRQYELALDLHPQELRDRGVRSAHAWPYCGKLIPHYGMAPSMLVERMRATEAWKRDYIDLTDAGAAFTGMSVVVPLGQPLPDYIPAPNLTVRTHTRQPKIATEHHAWFFRNEVHKYPNARIAPLRTLGRIAEGFQERCNGLERDIDRGLIRNPELEHPGVTAEWGAAEPYEFAQLRAFLGDGYRVRRPHTGLGQWRDCYIAGCQWAGSRRNLPFRVQRFLERLVAKERLTQLYSGAVPDMAEVIEGYRRDQWFRPDGTPSQHQPRWLALQAIRSAAGLRRRRAETQVRDAEIARRAAGGERTKSLALAYGLHPSTVGRIIENAIGRQRRAGTQARDAEILRRFVAGDRPASLAREYGLYPSTVGRILERDAPLIARVRPRDALHEQIVSDRGDGLSMRQIAALRGVSSSMVHKVLKAANRP